MTALLLANVGNHDLRLRDESLLPEELEARMPRPLGEEVKANFNRYAEVVELPLLGPTLTWLFEHEGWSPDKVGVHLFASDQQRSSASQQEWLKDTAPMAEAIREYLNWRWKMPKKAVHIHRIEGSPADYANTLTFYQRTLPPIRASAEAEKVYLEVSGGTPAMTSMLILIGVETFGQEVVTLYLDRDSKTPYEIGVSSALFVRKNREILNNQIGLYAYAAAEETLIHSGRLLLSDERERELLRHLLRYANRRLAFDYRRAQDELREAFTLATGNTQAQIKRWLRELSDPQASIHLAELIHSARIKLHLGDYADFTQRLFRFQEAIFRYMAEQMGIEYGKDSQYLSDSWRANQPDLHTFLNQYRRGADGKPLPADKAPIPVDTRRSLNRFSLGAIVDYYVQQPDWARWQPVAEQVFRLSLVADLRNRGIAGHGFEGIGLEDLETTFGGNDQEIIEVLTQAYESVFAQPPGDNPYDEVNNLIKGLVEG